MTLNTQCPLDLLKRKEFDDYNIRIGDAV